MEKTFTPKRVHFKKQLILLFTILGLFLSQFLLAHDITAYTASCITGPKYTLDPTVVNANSSTNYAWQYKNSSNVWVCIVNGNNTINGNTYNVSGATSTATTNPAPIVFNNPNSGLQGLVIRCIMSDGSGVNPCNLPSGNTYNSSSTSVNQTIDLNSTPCTSSLALGNRVWYDDNNDGINNSGEDGIANVTVYLYRDNNNDNVADGASIATDITDGNGYYLFNNLTPGNYIVGVVTPAGYMSSSVNAGDPDDNINYDDNGQVMVGNETRGLAITLAAGTEPDGTNTNTNTNITYDFGFLPDCACTTSSSNLLVNGSFEDGTTGWSSPGSNFYTGIGYAACGTKNGFNDWSFGTAKVYQDVAISPGATVVFKAFAGVHTAGLNCSPKLNLIFLNASNTVLDQTDVAVTRDVDANHNQLEQYTISDVAPVGATKVRVQSSINCNVMKLDAFCLTTSCTTPGTPTATVTQPTCALSTGSVTLSNLPSTGNWTITRNPGNNTTTGSGTTTTISGLAAGSYTFTVTNAGGCISGVTNATINAAPVTPVAPTVAVTQPTCALPTGSVALSNLPSTGNWTITRNPGAVATTGSGTTTTISGLAAGSYTFTVTNVSGCTSPSAPATINAAPVTPVAPTVAVTQPTCALATGSVALSNLPSTGNWTITRNPGAVATTGSGTTTTISGLAPGAYTFTVTNASGCTSPSAPATINAQPAKASIGDFVWIDANANGIIDGVDINAPLAGILVSLYNDADANGTPDAGAIATFVTLANGKYLFSNLCPGNYILSFGLKNGYARTVRMNTNNKDLNDSDPSQQTGFTGTINLGPGENDLSNDAGYYSTVILPVTFGAITAQARNCAVNLSFEMLTQKNTKQFEIEHSKDGSTWSNIAVIAAKGSSASSYTYTFTHAEPNTGMNLYRIKAVDADAKFMYSETVSTLSNCSGKGSIVTYPNPAYDILTVVLPSDMQQAQLQLFNNLGQLMISDAKKSGLVRQLDLQNLNSGIYLMKVIQDGKVVTTHKIVKGQ